ncbi:unnamed protein product [Fraxinus pennsylvanica]|uniref:B box-type domain-containing protein n=1 Tax=Fraxinus pennsylvanica TaxID=56036 RepID=A0AAD1Z9Y8_9LAMI|nr:unnamed protein product [Fraxinus pennsylvanica]
MGRRDRSFPEISFYSQQLEELKPPENLTAHTFMPIKLRPFPNPILPKSLLYISLSAIHLHTAREMKIQCDVCGKEEAYIFCTADEAALCQACDCRVHRANKLASKHPRFSLLHSSSKDLPRCDICRASTSLSNTGSNNANKNFQTNSNVNTSESTSTTLCRVHNNGSDQSGSQEGSVSTSSISEYLFETLPGWHVEELLDPSSSPYVFFLDMLFNLLFENVLLFSITLSNAALIEGPNCCGTKNYRVLLNRFHHVSTAFMDLGISYQEVIEDVVKKMGAGMAKFICKEIDASDPNATKTRDRVESILKTLDGLQNVKPEGLVSKEKRLLISKYLELIDADV